MSVIAVDRIENYLVKDTQILDVRAPIEFSQAAAPHSFNIPILDNAERTLVGTCYKQQGREAAIKLGHKIVSDENKKNKLDSWLNFLEKNPGSILTCFRGGLRSQVAQSFLAENKIDILRISGGYKRIRQIYLDEMTAFSKHENRIQVLAGETGSGKTQLIEKLSTTNHPHLDLEKYAAHRGSAFGKREWAQPAQATFENLMGHALLKYRHSGSTQKVLIEDESRVIGSLHLPEVLFKQMRQASIIQLIEGLDQRVQNIFNEYISADLKIYDGFIQAVAKIQKKLGGLRATEILQDLEEARRSFTEHQDLEPNKIWIEKMLVWYYDPMYQYSLRQREPAVEFAGDRSAVEGYLKSLSK